MASWSGMSSDGPEPPPAAPILERLAYLALLEQAVAALRRSEERFAALAGSADEERRDFEHQLAQRILRDPHTGLPNRALFLDRLGHALARAARTGSTVAVVCCDLDRFRSVNDSFGHKIGDLVVSEVADRLVDRLRTDDTVARIGGDEFAVLCEDLAGADDVVDVTRRAQEAFATPFTSGGVEVWVTASTGVAVTSGEGDADGVLGEATEAMHRAQRRGRGRVEVFDEAMRATAPWGQVTEHELRQAIATGELRLLYQPVVNLADGRLGGVEALVRWQHPSRGLLLPSAFIPLAEESGLVLPLGRWVLNEALGHAASWQQVAGAGRWLTLGVNVSAQQLREEGWAEEVAAALAAAGLPGERLVLEITESTLMEDTEVSLRRLAELRALGVRLAVDDFGTGYSSLAYLRRMPVDFLKIDKAFVDGVTGDAHESALARAVVKLAATLRLAAVAEGIESEAQLDALRSMGCEYGQGLWLAAAEPPEQITAWVKESKAFWAR
ncbi:MAG TPA: bifunctional diguanylate cyclase/phosphodiesterase [Acidimicrobiales bacterium]|nr:bifunctional diguanylate cyclase/phosphodiesterase [Acidimicrobiales bacterium]